MALEVGRGSQPLGTRFEATWVAFRTNPRRFQILGVLVGGVVVGLMLVFSLTLPRGPRDPSDVIVDNVVRVGAAEIDPSCWEGLPHARQAARVEVTFDLDVQGHVSHVQLSNDQSPRLRKCVADHVRGWTFLPQAAPDHVTLPIEVTR